MYYKLEPKFGKMSIPQYITNFGSFNEMPKPFDKCEMNDFLNKFHAYSPEYIEFRQVIFDGENIHNGLHTIHIYYFHDIAFGLMTEYDMYSNKMKLDVYRIGCKHDYESYKIGRCLTHYKCKKCGYEETIDSSD